MTTRVSTFPLRLPVSLKSAIEELSKADGTSINQLIVSAVAEKVQAMRTESYFAEARVRADFVAFRRILDRAGGAPARDEDVLPDDLAELGPRDAAS